MTTTSNDTFETATLAPLERCAWAVFYPLCDCSECLAVAATMTTTTTATYDLSQHVVTSTAEEYQPDGDELGDAHHIARCKAYDREIAFDEAMDRAVARCYG